MVGAIELPVASVEQSRAGSSLGARSVYGIADLHLEVGTGQRTQAALGGGWSDHPERLFAAWRATVPAEAVVLIPGDISWGRTLEQIRADLAELDALPGAVKVLSPGNHDYAIWKTQSSVNRALGPFGSLRGIRSGRAIRLADHALVVAAIRGSALPGDRAFRRTPDADRLYRRQLDALDRALTEAGRLRRDGDELVVMTHRPPVAAGETESAVTERIEAADAALCVFGHVHSAARSETFASSLLGSGRTRYALVACDALGFRPGRL